jgi:ubiquitin-protein ligase
MEEYEQFKHNLPPDGMYLLPVAGYLSRWDGVYFVPSGPWKHAILRFIVQAGDSYPSTIPEIIIKSDIIHPLIDKRTGKVDTLPAFPTWQETGWIVDILQYLEQIILLKESTIEWIQAYLKEKDHLTDTGILFLEHWNEFNRRASQSVGNSLLYLYEEADSGIVFKPWDLQEHPKVLGKVLSKPPL